MKHAIPVKFLAIVLCAASLLAVVASGLSIIVLAENGLYEKTVDELYTERVEERAYLFAQEIAQSYASTNLGNCPDEMIGNYHYFNYGYYGYTLKDAQGHVLETRLPEYEGEGLTFEFSPSGSYMNVVDIYKDTQAETLFDESYGIYDAVTEDPTQVYAFFYSCGETSESYGRDEPIGYLVRDESGRVRFFSYEPGLLYLEYEIQPDHIVFFNAETEPVYEVTSDGGVGVLSCDEGGLVTFVSSIATVENTLYEPTEYDVDTASQDAAQFVYYDAEQGSDVIVEYVWAVIPTYTVIMTVLPGAMYNDYAYTLAGVLSGFRDCFPWILAAGLLLFAITAVYLCCAAGRKSGSDEIRPAALNRFPLDLYLAGAVAAAPLLFIAASEGGTALFRERAELGLGFAAVCGYVMALIIVGFCFAFAAQVKAPGGYWYRNTFCGRVLRLILRFIRWIDRGVHKVWPGFCSGIRKLWGWFKRFVVGTYRFAEKTIIWVCTLLGRIIKTVWKYGIIYTVKTFKFIKSTLARFFGWLGRIIARFFRLLPLTWQWLLVGFVMMLVLFIGLVNRSEGLMLVSICGCVAIILYGAQCFGVLLESAKRMRQGDLDTKVEDKLLVGSFEEFARELNGLADVATVAVQKQLKSERMKTELITNVSHDIKTPLTSIINYVDLMQKPHSEEEGAQYLEVLDRQSQRLKKLVEDLMEMSKASSGNMAVELTRVDAAEAVNQALGEFADKLASVNLTPVFNHPEEPVMMMADGRLVWRVLSNLLSNAYKYALPNTRLYIDLMVLQGNAVIAIKNISKEQLNVDAEELMERFVRGDSSRNTEGSGLGLNIARSLVELQQGQMHLMVDGDLFKVTLVFPLA